MRIAEPLQKTISLYRSTIWRGWFVGFHFWEGSYQKIEKLLPKKGKIIDLGCGDGAFANYIALCSDRRSVLGYEIDDSRIRLAEKGIRSAKFIKADITKLKIPTADAIVIYHVLHHLPSPDAQQKLLEGCRKSLSKNGRLIVAEVEVKPTLKYLMAWITDSLLYPWFFEWKLIDQVYYRKSSDWLTVLTRLGFSCKIIKAEKGKPFPNVILECKLK